MTGGKSGRQCICCCLAVVGHSVINTFVLYCEQKQNWRIDMANDLFSELTLKLDAIQMAQDECEKEGLGVCPPPLASSETSPTWAGVISN